MIDIKNHRHVHCIGIGGIGLSAIAEILLSRGYEVSGSDIKASTVTEHLSSKGAKVYIGHAAENVSGADLLIYSTAVSMENPEIAAAVAAGIPVVSRSEALGAIMNDYPISVAIAGTHGKTTTTSMVSLILQDAEYSPTVLVGGILNELEGNVGIGSSGYFVTEACEYMDNFLDLKPFMEIILNIDSDHLDYFKDINHIARSFDTFAKSVPEDGVVVAFDANPFIKDIIDGLGCRVITFGFGANSDYHAENITFDELGYPSYDLYTKEGFQGKICLSVPGEHNVSNSLAAIAACRTLGVGLDVIQKTLKGFKGTHRRFDIIGKTQDGIVVIDDYAHHPTEIKATLAAARNFTKRKIWCLFQPHTYTRTLALFDEFADAFEDADKVIFAEIYAAREKNIYKLSSKALMDRMKERHPDKDVYFMPDFSAMAEFVKNNASEGDVVITMGAGDIYKVADLVLA